MTEKTLDALAECAGLRGLIIDCAYNTAGASSATDAGMARVLRANPSLAWLHIEVTRGAGFFGAECWEALRSGCCPEMHVLWVDARGSTTPTPPALVRRALAAMKPSLRCVVVNPDLQLKSRHGPKDRLDERN